MMRPNSRRGSRLRHRLSAFIEVVCPHLHHAHAFFPVLCGVHVSPADSIGILVRKLALDGVGTPLTHFVKVVVVGSMPTSMPTKILDANGSRWTVLTERCTESRWEICIIGPRRTASAEVVASRKGIEPLTPGLGNLCSILLSYRE